MIAFNLGSGLGANNALPPGPTPPGISLNDPLFGWMLNHNSTVTSSERVSIITNRLIYLPKEIYRSVIASTVPNLKGIFDGEYSVMLKYRSNLRIEIELKQEVKVKVRLS